MRISTLIMAVGLGLLIDLPATYDWSHLLASQLVVGIGVGPNFQCPLTALQAMTPPADHAAASSTADFLRNLSASVTVVASTAISQNKMQNQNTELVMKVGSEAASLLTGANAAASVEMIEILPVIPRMFAR